MTISLNIETTEFSSAEVRLAVTYAMQNEIDQAALRRVYLQQLCLAFERQHGMASINSWSSSNRVT